jgi:pimeloyl-ACP methyl ester carboxylesterase
MIFLSFYLLSIPLLRRLAHHLPLSMRRPICWVRAMALELPIAIFCYLMKPIARFFENETELRSGPPILLIHGYLHNASAWSYLKPFLAKKHTVYTINLKGPFRSIEDFSLQVAEKAKQIQIKSGQKKLILVGHSMGGLVAIHHALSNPHISRVVAIGSPLKGTPLARIAFGQCAKQMVPGSPFLSALFRFVSEPQGAELTAIGSETDELIFPYTSALPEGRGDRICFDDLGHAGLLFSPRVAEKLAAICSR